MFVQKLNAPDGIEKFAAEGAAFVRQKLRETAFSRMIINPQYVTKVDLTRSINHDGLVKIVDIEPESKAMTINMRGEPDSHYVMGDRFEIPFHGISSEDFQKTEEELLAYEMPITDIIEKNSVLDIQRIEDETFMALVDAAIAVEEAISAGSKTITGTYVSTGEIGSIKKSDLKSLFDTLDGDELRCDLLLMDSTMYNRLFLYNATTVGDAVGSEVTVNGYTYKTLFGRRVIVSNKKLNQAGSNFLNNKIYAFTSQEFLGQFCILNDTQFWIEKKKNIISWAAYEHIGIGIGNTRSCSVMNLS
jgi:hypothetical protein